jgi:hypothetical protein
MYLKRLIQGQVSISLDWNDLPADLIESLENLDNQKYHSIENKSTERVVTTRSQRHTFNNCHFHYEKKDGESKYDGRGNIESNLLPDPHNLPFPEKKPMVLPRFNKQRTSAMSVSEFDHPTERFKQSQRSTTSRPMAPSAFSQSIYSAISRQIDGADKRKVKLHSDGEKQVIQTVHQELCELSKDLKNKSTKIQEESMVLSKMKTSLNSQRIELEKKEKMLNADVQQLVAASLKKREAQIKQDTEKIVLKYEDALEQLSKENKRLQTSLKDMVGTSRSLREQNKKIQAEVDQKEAKLEDLTNQLKQAKDRAERLKVITATPTTASRPENLVAQDLFAQMKKIANTQLLIPKKTTFASTQTSEDLSDIDTKIISLKNKVQSSLSLIQYLLCQNTSQGSRLFFEAINSSFDYIRKECSNFGNCFEEYLFVIYKGLSAIPPADQHTLASHVYCTLSEIKKSHAFKVSEKSLVLLHLIPLYIISQPEVVDALLDGLFSQLSNSELSRRLILEFGIDPIIEMLNMNPVVESTARLASSVLVTLISEGKY